MITVSIQPFALKKILLLIAAISCLASTVCFADPVFMNNRAIPQSAVDSTSSLSLSDVAVNGGDAFSGGARALTGSYVGDAIIDAPVSLNFDFADSASAQLTGSERAMTNRSETVLLA